MTRESTAFVDGDMIRLKDVWRVCRTSAEEPDMAEYVTRLLHMIDGAVDRMEERSP